MLIAPTAWAQNKTYTVRQGDTISDIASRNKVRRAELVSANKQLQNPHKLKLGMVLTIPKSGLAQADNGKTTAVRSSASVAKPATQHSYAVRNGDKDWSIARKFGISVKQLQAANKGADLSSLRPGDKLTLPKGPSIQVKTASAAPKAVAVKGATVVHKVKAGENDWIIARRYDTTVAKIRAVNPGVERPLQIGTELKIPVAGKISTIAAVTTAKKITTRMARVKGESSIIRRGPSTSAEKITVVPAGTQVTVLDHESGWYKLRFPKATVGWMRGDLLEPISASKVAALVKSQRKDSQIE
ncbi:MAG TPA: LysM peptidoglycan-binding domain-containing protein, partial [Fimbriimonadaceae bacterium]|nr:LysM peptidoglycan-binding domain-containing protein [Fimbriimonadaceae bacterium]